MNHTINQHFEKYISAARSFNKHNGPWHNSFFPVSCFLNNIYCENLKSKFSHFQSYLDSSQDYLLKACTSVTLSKFLHLADELDLFHSPIQNLPRSFHPIEEEKDGLHSLLQFSQTSI